MKTSPLDFSGQRLGNTSLVVFLRFHSFLQVVKWPEFVRLYTTNILKSQCQISPLDRGPLCFHYVLGSLPTGTSVSQCCFTVLCAFYQAKPKKLQKTLNQNYPCADVACLSHVARIDLAAFLVRNERGTPKSLSLRRVSIQKPSSQISQLSSRQNDVILPDTNL